MSKYIPVSTADIQEVCRDITQDPICPDCLSIMERVYIIEAETNSYYSAWLCQCESDLPPPTNG